MRLYGGLICGVRDLHYKTKLAQVQIPAPPLNYTLPNLAEPCPYTWLLSILQLNESLFDLALLTIIDTVLVRGTVAVMKHNDHSNMERKGFIWLMLPYRLIEGSQDQNSNRAITSGRC